jgi:hypothetical protein
LLEPSLTDEGRTVGGVKQSVCRFRRIEDQARGRDRDGGRGNEVRFLGEMTNSSAAIERLVRKLGGRYGRLHFCYEAGPIDTGGNARSRLSGMPAWLSLRH